MKKLIIILIIVAGMVVWSFRGKVVGQEEKMLGGIGTVWYGRVNQNADDSFCYNDGTALCYDTSTLRFGYRYGANYGKTHLGFRFANVNVPKNATINSAIMTYQAFDTVATNTLVSIAAEATSTAQLFSTTAETYMVKNRATTTTFVEWDMPDQTSLKFYDSPELKTVIQEIVDREDWTAGNALALIIRDNNGTGTQLAAPYTIATTTSLMIDWTGNFPPTIEIKANDLDSPATIPSNQTVTLSWTTTNATDCTASGDWSGSKATTSSESIGYLEGTKTYTLTCEGLGGSIEESITVNIDTVPSGFIDYGNADSVRIPTQRYGFNTAGRFWVFYQATSTVQEQLWSVRYNSSTDGINWGTPTLIGSGLGGIGVSLDIYWDGTYVSYGWAHDGYNDLKYRRGIPNSDGTITWSAAEQNVYKSYAQSIVDFSLIVDSSGYSWFGFGSTTAITIWTSSTNDGTWTTKNGYPLTLDNPEPPLDDWLVFLIPQTNDKLYAVIYSSIEIQKQIYGYAYDGDNWGAKETISTSKMQTNLDGGVNAMIDAVNIGDDIHLVFYSTDNKIKYVKRTDGSWSDESILVTPNYTSTDSSPVLTVWDSNTINMFWIATTTIYYLENEDGTWVSTSTPNILLTDENIDSADIRCLQSYKSQYNGYGGILYESNPDNLSVTRDIIQYLYTDLSPKETAEPKSVKIQNGVKFYNNVKINN